jgi:peptidoglycan/xylan/chitin deacetylase (PgdA/CDA1 family)
MRVTLTFDNGPHPVGTPQTLAALAERDIPAIFFVVGERMTGSADDLVTAIVDDGHLVGNHTWSHAGPLGELTGLGAAPEEIARAQEAIGNRASDPPLFRPVGAAPGGVVDDRLFTVEAVETLRAGSFTVALWNVLPHDWESPFDWTGCALAACRTLDHAVIVLHDAYPAGLAALPAFLDALAADGAAFTLALPEECTPMIAGVPTPQLDPLIRGAPPRPHDLLSPHTPTRKE